MILSAHGKHQDALPDYERAIQVMPHDAQAFIGRGQVYRRMGKTKEALADYDKAAELNPQLSHAFTQRAGLYFQLNRHTEALADYQRVVALGDKADPMTVMYARALVELFNDRLDEMAQVVGAALKQHPDDPDWLYDAACVYGIAAAYVGKSTKLPNREAAAKRQAELTIETLEKAVQNGYGNFVHMRNDEDFAGLRNDPRFQRISGKKAK
jgi:tetratricopeptide (TPR) repeat protein